MIIASKRPGLEARIVSARPLVNVRAGSALVWHEGRLLVVQDDAPAVVWVDVASGQTESLVLEGSGEALEKGKKPDFEVAFLGPGRVVTILGSGSSANRCRRAVVDLDTNEVRVYEETALFEALGKVVGTFPSVEKATTEKVVGTFPSVEKATTEKVVGTFVNLEGGAIWRNSLRLFHRGAGLEPSAVLDLNLSVLNGAPPHIISASPYNLGQLRGVPLHFTDATVLGDRLAYLAVAEDTPNAIDDGPVVGAALGFLHGSSAYWTPILEASGDLSTRKVEGIAMNPQSGVVYGVTDPDDPDKPAELLTIVVSD
jgi:hypothetical protein